MSQAVQSTNSIESIVCNHQEESCAKAMTILEVTKGLPQQKSDSHSRGAANNTAIGVLKHALPELLKLVAQANKSVVRARDATREAERTANYLDSQYEAMLDTYLMICRVQGVEVTSKEMHDLARDCERSDCQECCPHEERDYGVCEDCGHEDDGSSSIDNAHEYVRGC